MSCLHLFQYASASVMRQYTIWTLTLLDQVHNKHSEKRMWTNIIRYFAAGCCYDCLRNSICSLCCCFHVHGSDTHVNKPEIA